MHTIHQTEGIVIGARNISEANRLLWILTKDLGLIQAHVQNIRGVESKLRYGLQIFSHSYIDFVRGKEGWRVSSAEPITNFGMTIKDTTLLRALGKMFTLLRRLLPGEEKHEELFYEVRTAAQFAARETLSPRYLKAFESVMVLRILSHLGYWENTNEEWLLKESYSPGMLERTEDVYKRIVKEINASLRATQL